MKDGHNPRLQGLRRINLGKTIKNFNPSNRLYSDNIIILFSALLFYGSKNQRRNQANHSDSHPNLANDNLVYPT